MSKHQITIEDTNNPSIVKFNSNKLLTQGGSYQYNNVDETKESPLSKQLFHLPFVSKVFKIEKKSSKDSFINPIIGIQIKINREKKKKINKRIDKVVF